MPSPTTNDEFLDLIRKSGVVDDKRLTGYLERLRAAAQIPGDPCALATQFVRDGVLTHFQAEHILQGKWRRFTIGKYKVLERLGSGGMGSVYLCEHTLMRRRVAVKVLPPAKVEDTSTRDRFYREARAVAALDHPNIVRAYDIDQDDKLLFLVMEHVDGSSLQEIIKRTGPMDVLRAAHYIRQAALGLQHAHETARLVHRDVKPGNILVDRNGIVKLLDMGLARFFHDDEDNLTQKYDENVLGTADYLAPEQARDSHNVDIRADIYSLGATFYFCLTGRTPFQEGTVALKLIWHQTRQPKPIRALRPEVPEGVAAIVEKMMAKTQEERYQTPQDVADALLAWTLTPIPPPPEAEMPQFSLAAKGLIAGETSTGPRTTADLSPAPRKSWQVAGAPPTAASLALPVPPSPSSPSASAGSTGRAAPTQVPGPPPTTVPAPAQPPSVARQPGNNGAQRPAVPAPVNGTVSPAPVAIRVAAVVVQESPSWQDLTSLDESSARSNRAGKASKARQAAAAQQEDDQEEGPPSSARRQSSRRMRGPAPLRKNALWLGLGAAILLGFFFILVLGLYFALTSGKDTKASRSEREPIRVSAANKLTLGQALRRAGEGDRIIVQDDIVEANLSVTTKNLIIEAESGKTILWKCPPQVSADSNLLIVGNAAGLQVRGFRFAGEQRVPTIIALYGKCPGAKFEKLELTGYKKNGVLVTNCEGDSANRVLFNKVSFTTPAGATAVHFTILPSLTGSVPRNRFFAFRECAFEGPGAKVTTQKSSALDADTVELPSRITIDPVP